MHQPNPLSAWFSVGADVWLLGFEAAAVIGLRGFRIAQGGAAAHAEAQRMIGEKIAALAELQQLAFAGKLGETAPVLSERPLPTTDVLFGPTIAG